jgi:hypothetical protein
MFGQRPEVTVDRAALLKRLRAVDSRPKGMQFAPVASATLLDEDALLAAVKAQREEIERVPAGAAHGFRLDGRTVGLGLRMSEDAFSDFCSLSGTPRSFLRALAREDEFLAQAVLDHQYASHFRDGRLLVVERSTGTILGATGETTYQPLPHDTLLDWARSALPGSEIRHGWVEGGHMRATVCRAEPDLHLDPTDTITTGVDLRNCLHGDGSVVIVGYLERLSCKNGLRVTDMTRRIPHRGKGMRGEVCKALVAVAAAAHGMQALLTCAHETPLADVAGAKAWISEPGNGGSQEVAAGAWSLAQNYAGENGHATVHVMDLTSGVSEVAHQAPSLSRRVAIETLAYTTLARYLNMEANT